MARFSQLIVSLFGIFAGIFGARKSERARQYPQTNAPHAISVWPNGGGLTTNGDELLVIMTENYISVEVPDSQRSNINMTNPIKIAPPIKIYDFEVDTLDCSQRYDNGTLAVQAYTTDGEAAATVSVNLPNHAHLLGENEFFLKDYSENAPIAAALIERGIIEILPRTLAQSGFVALKTARIKV